MGGKSKGAKTQVSAYLMSLHVGFCYSVDVLLELLVKEKSVWKGWSTSNETLTIDQKNLFGGEKKEGGLLGGVEVMHGRSSQVMREDLAGRLGRTSANTPGFRDILSLFFYGAPGYGFQWSMNYPYLHSIWAKVKRTETGWYSAKKEIFLRSLGESTPTVEWDNQYKYQLTYGQTSFGTPAEFTQVGYDDSAWPTAPGGFANNNAAIGGRSIGTPIVSGYGNSIWLRKRVTVTGQPSDLTLTLHHDDGCRLWWNGTEMAGPGYGLWTLVIPASLVLTNNVLAYQVIDGIPHGDATGFGADIAVSVGSVEVSEVDMNPAHIIRECFTNTDWGMGLPGARIDDAAFTEAADTLYDEGFGLSMVWSGQSSVETFVDEVLEHIDGVYGVDPSTGKIYIRLIRGGYDLGSLAELTEDDGKITQFNRKAVEETTNEIVVTWTNPDNEGEETVSVHDLANYAAQQTIISSSRNYYGIRSSSLAIRAALRELNKASQPLASFEMQVSRKAWNYKPGDVLKITSTEYGLNALPCRIVKTNYGKPGEMAIKLTLIEDVFEMPESSYVVSEPTLWEPVVPEIAAVSNALVTTAPYFALARTLGDAAASGVTDTEAYSLILAQSSGLVELFTSSVNAAGNTSYASAGTIEPCGRGTLASGLAQEVTSTVSLSGYSGLDLTSGIFLLIGTEVAIVESVSPLVVRRGMLDTVPKVWAVDTEVWAFDWNADLSDEVEHLVGATVNYRLAPDGQGGDPYIARSATLTKRAVRPYRPANVKINTQLWPTVITGELAVTWAHRNRLVETSVPLKWDEASTTPEAGTTYNVKFYAEGVEVKAESVSGTSSSMTYAEETGAGGATDPHEADVVLRISLDDATPVDDKGHTLTVYGNCAISTEQAKYWPSSLKFDGTGDYLVATTSPDFVVGTGDFCIEGWFYFTALSTSGGFGCCLFDTRPAGDMTKGFALFAHSTGVLTALDANANDRRSNTGVVTTGGWLHIAAFRKDGVMTVTVGGYPAIQYPSSFNYNPSTTTVIVGAPVDYQDTSAAYKIQGYVDDFRFTKVARYLSHITETSDTFAGSNVLDMPMDANFNDTAGHTTTPTGDAQISSAASHSGGASGLFDGAGDYVVVPSSTDFDLGTGDFTIDMWVKTSQTTTYATLFNREWGGAPYSGGFTFLLNGPSGGPAVYAADYSTGSPLLNSSVGGHNDDNWHHLAWDRKGAINTLYLDEKPVSVMNAAFTIASVSKNLTVGADLTFGRYYNGYMDKLRITKGASRYKDVQLFTPPDALTIEANGIAGNLRVTLEAVRDGHTSEQMFDHSFARAGYGLQYGNYYGGI